VQPTKDTDQTEGRIASRVRVGVTGHRDLRDDQALAERVREALGNIRETFRATDTTDVTFSVVCALAEGADRLVVREARGLLSGFDLYVVLPMEMTSYLEDFATDKSKREFLDLMTMAMATAVAPMAETREAAYEFCAKYVVDHSDVMIAIWDGEPSRARSGVGETIAYARTRGVPVVVVPTGA
jgi:hypothetical protein